MTESAPGASQPDLTRRQTSGLGWLADLPDVRDYRFAEIAPVAPTPPQVDLELAISILSQMFNQLTIGSCTGQGIGKAYQALRQIEGLDPWVPSRLWLYYYERVMEGTVGFDAGAQIRDGLKVLATAGVPPEALWPYDISRFTQEPGVDAQTEAPNHKAIQYFRVGQDEIEVRACLAAGYPIVFGFSVYQSFMSDQVAKTGVVPMPSSGESLLGGHCVYACGYNSATPDRWAKCGNSWGLDWGDRGFFYLPMDYILNPDLADDFWTMRLVT